MEKTEKSSEIYAEEKTIEKRCCYCERATIIKGMEACMCDKFGAVAHNFVCKKFIFDPLKLSPMLPAKRSKFSAEDFAF